jgi:endonuclease/exonuclease/phosphatase (EEP) superfamily protein YafD
MSTSSFHPVAARVQVPGVRFDPVVASFHVTSPVRQKGSFHDWRRAIAAADGELADFAHIAGAGAVIVGGDFNSTPDMRQFRDLLADGYRDAVAQTGAGWGPTFPSNSWIPPLITIDHVLTRQAAATAIKTVRIPGSDHRGLLSTIQVALDPTAS